jgi:ornithine cyclodeaminase/alanine dehydrogenase-like protein (mu-crystallin family)
MEDSVAIRVFNRAEVQNLLSVMEAIETIEEVWRYIAGGEILLAKTEELVVKPQIASNHASAQRASIPPLGVFGVKWGTNFAVRPPGTALHYGLVILNDIEDGKPFAIMDSRPITSIRTGANAALAAKYLAKKNSRTIAIIGCGEQGRSHLAGLNTLFRIETVRIYDLKADLISGFIRDMAPLVPTADILAASSPREAIADADVVCMVTSAEESVVMESWVPRGCFVCGTAQFRDLDAELVKTADKFVVGYRPDDSRRLLQRHPTLAGKISAEDIDADMPDLVSGRAPGRENDDERILYVLTGYGVLDVAIAHAACAKARALKIGTAISL